MSSVSTIVSEGDDDDDDDDEGSDEVDVVSKTRILRVPSCP